MIQKGLSALKNGLRVRRTSRPAEDQKPKHYRVPPYAPEMASGANGIEAMRRVLGDLEPEPLEQAVCRVRAVPTTAEALDDPAFHEATPAPAARQARDSQEAKEPAKPASSRRPSDQLPRIDPPKEPLRGRDAVRASLTSLMSGMRLGSAPESEPKVSRRRLSRIKSDPFVQRLARLQ